MVLDAWLDIVYRNVGMERSIRVTPSALTVWARGQHKAQQRGSKRPSLVGRTLGCRSAGAIPWDRTLAEEKRCELDRLYQCICSDLDALLRAISEVHERIGISLADARGSDPSHDRGTLCAIECLCRNT